MRIHTRTKNKIMNVNTISYIDILTLLKSCVWETFHDSLHYKTSAKIACFHFFSETSCVGKINCKEFVFMPLIIMFAHF